MPKQQQPGAPAPHFRTRFPAMLKRSLQLAALTLTSLITLGASNFDRLGHQLVCQCGCGQILLECNHVGCPVSGPMIKELQQQMAAGLSDSRILNWFTNKYGPIVLAAPIRGGFDTVAWIVPFAVLALGILLVVFLIRRWNRNRTLNPTAAPAAPTDPALRDRIRHDTTWE